MARTPFQRTCIFQAQIGRQNRFSTPDIFDVCERARSPLSRSFFRSAKRESTAELRFPKVRSLRLFHRDNFPYLHFSTSIPDTIRFFDSGYFWRIFESSFPSFQNSSYIYETRKYAHTTPSASLARICTWSFSGCIFASAGPVCSSAIEG